MNLAAGFIALCFVLGALALSMLMLWGTAKQVSQLRDRAHVRCLRANVQRLQDAGYLEAAEQFQEYADAMEAGLLGKKASS